MNFFYIYFSDNAHSFQMTLSPIYIVGNLLEFTASWQSNLEKQFYHFINISPPPPNGSAITFTKEQSINVTLLKDTLYSMSISERYHGQTSTYMIGMIMIIFFAIFCYIISKRELLYLC